MRTPSYFPNKSQLHFPVDTAQTVPAFAATTLAATLHDSDDALELPSSIEELTGAKPLGTVSLGGRTLRLFQNTLNFDAMHLLLKPL